MNISAKVRTFGNRTTIDVIKLTRPSVRDLARAEVLGAPRKAAVRGATPTAAVPTETTISIDDLRNEPTDDEQDFVPSAERARRDLAIARKNARRGGFSGHSIDLARGGR